MSGYPELELVNAQKILKLLHPDQIEESKTRVFLAIFLL